MIEPKFLDKQMDTIKVGTKIKKIFFIAFASVIVSLLSGMSCQNVKAATGSLPNGNQYQFFDDTFTSDNDIKTYFYEYGD